MDTVTTAGIPMPVTNVVGNTQLQNVAMTAQMYLPAKHHRLQSNPPQPPLTQLKTLSIALKSPQDTPLSLQHSKLVTQDKAGVLEHMLEGYYETKKEFLSQGFQALFLHCIN